MKAYFEKVYQKDNTLFCMTIQEPFEDCNGNMTKETYFIHSSILLSDGELTDWYIMKSYTNKKLAVKYFESLIK